MAPISQFAHRVHHSSSAQIVVDLALPPIAGGEGAATTHAGFKFLSWHTWHYQPGNDYHTTYGPGTGPLIHGRMKVWQPSASMS